MKTIFNLYHFFLDLIRMQIYTFQGLEIINPSPFTELNSFSGGES